MPRVALVLLALLLMACPPEESSDCGIPADTYSAGLAKEGESSVFSFTMVSDVPAPPDRGDNVFTMRIVDGADAAMDDGSLIIRPFMPEHGHGTTPETFETTFSSDGTYESAPVDLFMPGAWELNFEFDDGAGTTDAALFTFCIEG